MPLHAGAGTAVPDEGTVQPCHERLGSGSRLSEGSRPGGLAAGRSELCYSFRGYFCRGQASAGITPQALVEDSSEEDPDEEDGSADEIMQLLRKAKKAAPGGATSSEKPKSGILKKSSRYALLTAGKSNEKLASSNGIETLLQQAINSGQPELASQSLNAMVSMELLKVLRGKSGKKSSSSALAPDEQEDSDASSRIRPAARESEVVRAGL